MIIPNYGVLFGYWSKEGLQREGSVTNFLVNGTVEVGDIQKGQSVNLWTTYFTDGTKHTCFCGKATNDDQMLNLFSKKIAIGRLGMKQY